MIRLHKRENKDFFSNGDVILKPYSCEINVEINGIIELTLEHEFDSKGRYKFIDFEDIISAPYFNKSNNQLFKIYDIDKDVTGIRVKARHIFFNLCDEVLVDRRPTAMNGRDALNYILRDTEFTGDSDITKIETAYYIRKYIANQALLSDDENSFINRWGGELDVDNFKISMNKRIGEDKGLTFRYGKNISNINENGNTEDICTAILPVGYDGVTIPEQFVYSPYHSIFKKTRIMEFSDIKLKSKPDDEEGFSTIEEVYEALRNECKKQFELGVDKLPINIELDVVQIEKYLKNASLGDDVKVIYEPFNLDIKTRVVKLTFNCLNKKVENITLGSITKNFIDNIASIDKKIQKTEENIKFEIENKTNQLQASIEINAEKIENKVSAKDVKTIITQSATEVKTAFNDGSDYVKFIPDGIETSHNDGSSTYIGRYGVRWRKGSTSRDYHYLMYTVGFTTTGEPDAKTWIQLPDEFKGKNFSAMAVLSDTWEQSWNYGEPWVLQRMVTFAEQAYADYENARVPVRGYRTDKNFKTEEHRFRPIAGVLIVIA